MSDPYRTRPVAVRAVQWTGDDESRVTIASLAPRLVWQFCRPENLGHWIVVERGKRPVAVSPDMFAERYEPVVYEGAAGTDGGPRMNAYESERFARLLAFVATTPGWTAAMIGGSLRRPVVSDLREMERRGLVASRPPVFPGPGTGPSWWPVTPTRAEGRNDD